MAVITPQLRALVSRGDDKNEPAVSPATIGIIVAAVVALMLSIGGVAFYFFWNSKTERLYREACKKDPYLTRKEFRRRRGMSSKERIEEDEMQRNMMLQKSYAGRSSRSTYRSHTDEYSDMSRPFTHQRTASQDSDDWDIEGRAPQTSNWDFGPRDPHPGREVYPPFTSTPPLHTTQSHHQRPHSPTKAPLLAASDDGDLSQRQYQQAMESAAGLEAVPPSGLEPVYLHQQPATTRPAQPRQPTYWHGRNAWRGY